MKTITKIAMACTLILGLGVTTASADVVKGQKLFIKKMKKSCGFNGAKFASKHSQDEWETIKSDGKFEDEMIKLCPNVKKGAIKESWQQHIYDFSYEYANDSGNVPSC